MVHKKCVLRIVVNDHQIIEDFLHFISVLDAWGKVPAGILSGNYFDLGAFSQCFHINQNDKHYPTQYCIGQFKISRNEMHQRATFFPK